jgi:hypothetical protein
MVDHDDNDRMQVGDDVADQDVVVTNNYEAGLVSPEPWLCA